VNLATHNPPPAVSGTKEGVRHLRHPGPVEPVRLETMVEASGRAVRIALPAGSSILEGVTGSLASLGITSGTMTLLGGGVRDLHYVLAVPDPTGGRAVAFTDVIDAVDATLVTGGGTIGLDPAGQPLLHCHALFGGAGREAFGGHLMVDRTIVGEGTVALVHGFRNIAVAVQPEPEINAPIFRPRAGTPPAATNGRNAMSAIETGHVGRIAYAHVRPNEDLVQAVQKVALVHGFRAAFVRGSLGSLTDACLADAQGGTREVRGPAVEVLSVVGEVRSDADGSPDARLSGVVADPQGGIHGGRFVSGRNPVCMTFELVLEEWLPDAA
jgi:predicted DNA-binding protein with PD1-like motif